jgi:hypothetical protein
MDAFADLDPGTVLSGRADPYGADHAAALAAHPLDCVDTEYPHHGGAVEGPDDTVAPAEDHPVFYGCFDWHSAVHSHWSLVRGLRLFGDHPDADAIVDSLDGRVTDENVAREVAYLEENPGFEEPYGWAWLLRLAAELHLWDDARADRWRATLRPLEERVVAGVEDRFLTRERPVRTGTHHNTAFALTGVLDYARVVGEDELAADAAATTRRLFGGDVDAPLAYEPLGWDFLSPALTAADAMRRVEDALAFADWFDDYLPAVAGGDADALPDPVAVEREDGLALHLVGLNCSRAWCLAGLAEALDGRRPTEHLRASAADHAAAGLDRAFTDDYAGAHWLTSFVLYLLTRAEGGVAPAT